MLKVISYYGLIVGGAYLAGAVFAISGWFVFASLFFLVVYQHLQQDKLIAWLRDGGKGEPPELFAQLDEITSVIVKLKHQSDKNKRKLRKFSKSFKEMAEALPDAAIIVNKQGLILMFNGAAQQILGLNPKLDINKKIDYLIRNVAFQDFWNSSKQKRNKKPVLIFKLSPHKNLYLEVNRFFLSQGNSLIIARDITRIVLLEEKRKAFIDNASHELKTPLTVLKGFLEILQQQKIPIKWQVPINEMNISAQRMQELVEDMLKLATLENTRDAIATKKVYLPDFLEDIAQTSMQRSPLSIKIKAQHIPQVTLQINENIMRSAISNLLINALLHARAKTKIELCAAQIGANFLITVTDDGIGIANEHLNRVTERFYRVENQTTEIKGSGLGLAIVKHSIEMHDGSLDIISVPDSGSTFILRLPIAAVIN